jgi:hypothetical protein
MFKSKLILCILLFCSVSSADEIVLTNGYVIENVQLIGELNDILRYKGKDIVIALSMDQIQSRQMEAYDPSKPSVIILSNKKAYENFYRDNGSLDTMSQLEISTKHGETIKGHLSRETDSDVIIKADYGLITIAKKLIIGHMDSKKSSLKVKNILTVVMISGESLDGEEISSTDSSVIYRTDIGDLAILKRNIKSVSNAKLDNRTLLLGDKFAITMYKGEYFEGVLLSSTDSTETYDTKMGNITIFKQDIKNSILTVCSAPLDSKFLLVGNSFKITMVNGDSFGGTLFSSTDSTLTYRTIGDNITLSKRNILTVVDTSLDNKFTKSTYKSIITLMNKVSFYGKRISSTDSTSTFQTNIGKVTILKKNIQNIADSFEDLIYQINDARIIMPSLFIIYAGTAFPLGDFAKTSDLGGGAQTGFAAGIQFVTGNRIGFLLDVSYSYNGTNVEVMKNALKDNLQRRYGPNNFSITNYSTSNWNNILFLTGLKFGTKDPNSTNYFVAPIIGLDLSMYPKISGDISGTYYSSNPQGLVMNTFTGQVTQTSASTIAFVYGATAEAIISERFTISARYISGKSNYDLAYSDNSKGTIKQNISLFQLCAGIVFLK